MNIRQRIKMLENKKEYRRKYRAVYRRSYRKYDRDIC